MSRFGTRKEGLMTIGWDVSDVEGAIHDIPRLYVKIPDRKSVRKFFKENNGYPIFVWQVCYYIRPEFPCDTRMDLGIVGDRLALLIHPPDDTYNDDEVNVKIMIALDKARESAKSLMDSIKKPWDEDTSKFVVGFDQRRKV